MYEPCGYQGGAASYTSSMKENDSRVMHAQSTEAAKNKNQRFKLCSPSDGLLLPSQIPAGNEVAFFVLRCQSITSQSPHENLPSKKKTRARFASAEFLSCQQHILEIPNLDIMTTVTRAPMGTYNFSASLGFFFPLITYNPYIGAVKPSCDSWALGSLGAILVWDSTRSFFLL